MLSKDAVKTRSIVGVSAGATSAQSSCSLYSFSAWRADHHHTTHLRSNSIEASHLSNSCKLHHECLVEQRI